MSEQSAVIKAALDDLRAALEAKVESRLRAMEAKSNRQWLGMGGGGETAITRAEASKEQKAFETFMRKGDDSELKAMSLSNDPSGGYTVPTDIARTIMTLAVNFSPLRKIANVLPVGRADFKQLIATSGVGASWVSESATRSETTSPDFAAIHPMHGELESVVGITRWLLEDSDFDLSTFISKQTGRSHGVAEGAAFMNGTGVNQPSGLLTYLKSSAGDSTRAFGTLQYVPSGSAATVAGPAGSQADGLIDALYALKPEYRANASWLAHPSALAALRKLKSTTGELLFSPSLIAGQPATLLGAPIYEDANLDAPAADAFPIAVGDFGAGYLINDIGSPVLIRDEVTSKGRVLFYIAKRVGGGLVDSNAIKLVKCATS